MGVALATALVVSNVIGVGIFTTSGLLARDLRDPRGLLGIWVIGGVLALSGALCYAELGVRVPRAGGEYAYLREAYGPLPAFLSGWSSLFAGFSAPVAAAAVGFTEYLSSYYPALHTQGPGAPQGYLLPGHFVAAAVILAFSALHYRRVQVGGPVHIVLTSFKVGFIATFIILGFAAGRGQLAHFQSAVPVSGWGALTPAVASGLIFVMFSYSGWNAAAYIAGEIRNPARDIPRSLLTGTLLVIVLYVAMNALYIFALAPASMASEIRIAEVASRALFGLNIAPVLNVVFMGTILGSISAMIIAGPRIYYAMAHDGLFPAAIARVHPRFGTPANSIVLQGAWSVLLVFTGGFEQLLTFSGVVMIFFSALTIAALFRVRGRQAAAARGTSFRSPGFPWTALLFIAVSAWILAVSFGSRPKESFAGLLVIGSGIPFYFYWMRMETRQWVWLICAAFWLLATATWCQSAGYSGVSIGCGLVAGLFFLCSVASWWSSVRG
jgi:APA family basic amino acid/polyamine antiporter